MDVDFTARPVGSFFGGKHPRTVQCPKCNLPGVLVKTARRATRDGKLFNVESYAHSVSFELDAKKDAKPAYGPLCNAWKQISLTAD